MAERGRDPTERERAALELEAALDEWIGRFGLEREALVRTACAVPDVIVDLRPVVTSTLLGHAVSRLVRLYGRSSVERLFAQLCDSFESIDAEETARRGRIH